MKRTYIGRIIERDHGEALDILALEGMDSPLAQAIQDDLELLGNYVSVSYFISDERKTEAELEDGTLRALLGDFEVDYTDHYSEVTGYLWTDESLVVGGHDLLHEFRSYLGKYLHLRIVYERGGI